MEVKSEPREKEYVGLVGRPAWRPARSLEELTGARQSARWPRSREKPGFGQRVSSVVRGLGL